MALKDIDHIVFVMLENRSFDHLCGYLSTDDHPIAVEGIGAGEAWLKKTANYDEDGNAWVVNKLTDPKLEIQDPPHGWQAMQDQINTPAFLRGPRKMGGFVWRYIKSRLDANEQRPRNPGAVMGYYGRDDVWMYDFFARHYRVCDRWFAPLPAGTHPNKLMALAGYSKIFENTTPLPDHHFVYDWCKTHSVKWRCYVSGGILPFVALVVNWWKSYLLSFGSPKHFKRYRKFKEMWQSAETAPSVILIEPRYAEFGTDKANDDHSPAPIYRGQRLLEDIYNVLIGNGERWKKTLMIVTYDESGGFFDHVEPARVKGQGGSHPFETTGPRVPAFLVSPHVAAGVPFHETVDHTSFLALLGERFGGGSYSSAVDERQIALGGRLANALLDAPRTGEPPRPTAPPGLELKAAAAEAALAARAPEADTVSAVAFDAAARMTAQRHPDALAELGGIDEYVKNRRRPVLRHFDHIGDE
jgi:phospholipase C